MTMPDRGGRVLPESTGHDPFDAPAWSGAKGGYGGTTQGPGAIARTRALRRTAVLRGGVAGQNSRSLSSSMPRSAS